MNLNYVLGLASALFGISLLAFVQSANAATFDFNALAAGNEHGAVSETFTDGSLSVTASGRSLDGSLTYLMYLDEELGPDAPGGLGVCKFASGECVPGNDDNTSLGEVLQLVFSSPVVITSIEWSNGFHSDIYNGNFGVSMDSTPTSVGDFTQFPMSATFNTPLGFATIFSYISDSTISGNNDDTRVHYISKLTAEAIPEPMTAGLLAIGLAGAALRRRYPASREMA